MRLVCLVRPVIAALVLSLVGAWTGQALAQVQPSLQPPQQPMPPTLHPTQPSKKSATAQPGLLPQGAQNDPQSENKSGADKSAADKSEKSKLSPADQTIREAFQKSKTAST